MSLQLSPMEQMFFIARDPGKSGTIQLLVELYEEVDFERMKEAAEAALAFFPRLHEKIVLTGEGKLVLRPNDLPAPVFEEPGKPLLLGSAETNGYLFAVKVSGREISFSMSHAIADADLAHSFLRQLMYEYFCLSGEEIPDEGLVYTDPVPADHLLSLGEAIDAFEKQNPAPAGENEEPPETAVPMPPAVEIYSEWPLFGTPYSFVADVTWNNEELMRTVKELNATPFSFLSAVIAHAAGRAADTDGKVIRESYGYSLRKLLNVPSQCVFTVPAEICYELCSSVPETLREIRSRMETAGKLEKLLKAGKTYDMYAELLLNGMDMHNIVPLTEKLRARWQNTAAETFYFANPGIMRFPSRVQEKICSFSPLPEPQKKVTDLYSFVYNGRGTLRTVVDSTEEHLLKHVSSILKDFGINCTYSEIGKVQADHVDVLQFERE